MDSISFEYLLSSKNINNEIYDCDIDRWLGIKLDIHKRKEVKDKLTGLVRLSNQNN